MKGKRNVSSEGMELVLQDGVARGQIGEVGGVCTGGLLATGDLGTQASSSIAFDGNLSGAPGGIALVVPRDIATSGASDADQQGDCELHVLPSPMHVR